MDWTALRTWPKAFAAALALALLLSLLSFHLQDPTLTNLRLPSNGIGNWLGLPGALLGGSLLEALGSAALAVPLLLLNWGCCTRNRPPLHRYVAWSALLVATLAGLQGLAAKLGDPSLMGPGLAGWCVRYWAGLAGGPWLAALLLGVLGATAARRVLYAPLLHAAARDARVLAVWGLRQSLRRCYAGWSLTRRRAARFQRVIGAAGLGLSRRSGRGLRHAVRAALRPLQIALGWLAALRAPSLARIKLRAERATTAPWAPVPEAAADATGDGFEHWFGDVGGDGQAHRAAAPAEPSAVGPRPEPQSEPEVAAAPPPAPPAGPDGGTEAGTLAGLMALNEPYPVDAPAALTAEPEAAPMEEAGGAAPGTIVGEAPSPPVGRIETETEAAGGYTFERPEAESAWRERFQRYARNLDLDWEEQLWRRREEAAGDAGDAGTEDP